MPTPTIPDLLAGDITIEEVWRDILRAAKLNAFITFSDGTKLTPYVEIEFEETAASDRYWDYTVPGSDPVRVVSYPWVFNGSLVTRICTTPGRNSAQQRSIIGTVRSCAGDFAALFNTDVLPWHGINLFKESGKKCYVDPEELLHKTELRHRVHYNVRSTSWELLS
jgi:hypothetical protein